MKRIHDSLRRSRGRAVLWRAILNTRTSSSSLLAHPRCFHENVGFKQARVFEARHRPSQHTYIHTSWRTGSTLVNETCSRFRIYGASCMSSRPQSISPPSLSFSLIYTTWVDCPRAWNALEVTRRTWPDSDVGTQHCLI